MTTLSKLNNFDLVRLILSIIVVLQHSYDLTGNSSLKFLSSLSGKTHPVASFFVISGFLIASSYERSSGLKSYFEKRARRILPAYIFVVIFWLFVGVFLSQNTLRHYFSLNWLKFLIANLSFLNFLQDDLPGVFVDNKYQTVNGALWTIKIEVAFYFILPIIIYLTRKFNPIYTLLTIYLFSFAYYITLTKLSISLNKDIFNTFALQLPGQLTFFIVGIAIYKFYNNWKKYNKPAFAIAIIYCVIILKINIGFVNFLFFPIFLAILILFICMEIPYLGNFGKYGDFSYGLYIWHYPIIQTFVNYHWDDQLPPFVFVFCIMVTSLILAFLSWHFIEKIALRKDSHYLQAEGHK